MLMPTKKKEFSTGASEVDFSLDECGAAMRRKKCGKHIIFHYLKLAENNIARFVLVQMENYFFKTFVRCMKSSRVAKL